MDWQFKVSICAGILFALLPFLVKDMPPAITWGGIVAAVLFGLWGIPWCSEKILFWPGLLLILSFSSLIAGIIWAVQASSNSQPPLPITAVMTDAEYPVGTFISQITSIPDCFFQTKDAFDANQQIIDFATGNRLANPLVLIATDAGYKLHCSQLPANRTLSIVIALANVRFNPAAHPPDKRPMAEKLQDRDYVLRFGFSDGSAYWMGHLDGDVYAGPRPEPQSVKIDGGYSVGDTTFRISRELKIAGKVTISRSEN